MLPVPVFFDEPSVEIVDEDGHSHDENVDRFTEAIEEKTHSKQDPIFHAVLHHMVEKKGQGKKIENKCGT
jgi:hypothetical protein